MSLNTRTLLLFCSSVTTARGLVVPGSATAQVIGGTIIPTRFLEHRIFVRPVTAHDDTLTLLSDTGGGLFLFADVATRYDLQPDAANTVRLPAFRSGADLPAPRGSPGGRWALLPRPPGVDSSMDGMLGQAWFADRVWTLDYPGERLMLWPDSVRAATLAQGHRVPLGFPTDSSGRRPLSFPRIRVEIDGDSLDLLFDSGATVRLTETAASHVADGGMSERATSFITTSVLRRWRAHHPEWRVIQDADRYVAGMTMIEVPVVSVAGHRVGPVWFTERPDPNFHEYMSRFMDRRVEGALGGSALRFFRVHLDYPGASAVFEIGPDNTR